MGDSKQVDGVRSAQEFILRGGSLCIDGRPINLPGYELISELGRGANGVVYKALNLRSQDYEAVKIWARMRSGDERNKREQGLRELNKLARAASPVVVRVNRWEIIDDHIFGFLEYLDGHSLAVSVRKYKAYPIMRLELAKMYLFRLRDMAQVGLFHGDPHLKNVMTYEVKIDGNTGVGIKFLDFGVSNNFQSSSAAIRQNRIVWNTIRKICGDVESFEFCTDNMKWALDAYRGKNFLWHSYWSDVLNCMLDFEIYKQRTATTMNRA